MIYEDLLETLKDWDWTDPFELEQIEGEVIAYLIEKWLARKEYQKKRYEANREAMVADSKRRYYKNKEALIMKRRAKVYGEKA